MAIYAGPPPSGRREARTAWTYADGTKVCPSDVNVRAKLFAKMLKNLDRGDLATLDVILSAKRLEFLSKDFGREARVQELERLSTGLPCETLSGAREAAVRAEKGAPPPPNSSEAVD